MLASDPMSTCTAALVIECISSKHGSDKMYLVQKPLLTNTRIGSGRTVMADLHMLTDLKTKGTGS